MLEQISMENPYGEQDIALHIKFSRASDYVIPDVLSLPGEYTLSFWYKGDTQSAKLDLFGATEQLSVTTDWQKYTKTFEVTALDKNAILFTPLLNKSLYLYEASLVQGSKETGWTPSPEDIKAQSQAGIDIAADSVLTYAQKTYQTKGDYPSKTEMSSAIETATNGITLSVSEKFDNLGADNLFAYTDEPSLDATKAPLISLVKQTFSTSINSGNLLQSTIAPETHGYLVRNNTANYPFIRFEKFLSSPADTDASMNGLVAGKTYTLSLNFSCRLFSDYTGTSTRHFRFSLYHGASTDTSWTHIDKSIEVKPGVKTDFGRISWTFTVPKTANACYLMFMANETAGHSSTDYFMFSDITLVTGSQGIGWMPSSSQAISEIKITTDGISQKVDKNGVISSINQSSEEISIDASKINLTGYVTVKGVEDGTTTINGGCLTTGQIKSQDYEYSGPAGSIGYSDKGTLIDLANGNIITPSFYVGNGNANFKGNLVGATGTFAGSLQAATGSFSGSVTASQGYIGGWQILAAELRGASCVINSANGTVQSAAAVNGASRYATLGDGKVTCLFLPGAGKINTKAELGYVDVHSSSSSTKDYRIGLKLGDTNPDGSSFEGCAVYASGTALFLDGQTVTPRSGITVVSDHTMKKDINPLMLDERWIKFFYDLEPVSFKYVDGNSGRTHIGYIAQDVVKAAIKNGITEHELALVCTIDNYTETGESIMTLRYEEFIALNTCAVQQLNKTISEQEQRIAKLEQLVNTLLEEKTQEV